MKEKTTINKDVRMAAAGPYPEKRAGFKTCLLANPNYFGTIQKSDLVPVFPMKWNTHYEELVCVGYHPQEKTLEGVVHIYQPTGYGTDECGAGTPEYVRFFLSYDKGTTWEDMGVTGFRAYNIPEGTQKKAHLEYAVSLTVDPKHKHCFLFKHPDTLVRVRAILSWNDEPDAGDPDFSPVWGNVKEATIQIDPEQYLLVKEIYAVEKFKDANILKASAEAGNTIPIVQQHLSATELAELYRNEDVPVHRFAFKEFAQFANGRVATAASKYLKSLKGIKIPDNLVELLHPKTDGDTSYEELKCIGLDPNHPDRLVGIIKVKKACGYSGPVCTSKGSVEYVTFWADFDGNGSFETCLGTADVTVHDIPTIKNDGIFYAVTLPVDLSKFRPKCSIPKVVRIRAILSWNSPVAYNCPSCVPCWGNREETLINIAPESACPMPVAEIAILGGIPVSMIDADGLTIPDARFAAVPTLVPDSLGRPCPFGGYITVHGAPVNGAEYLVEVSKDGGATWSDVFSDIWVTHKDGTMHKHSANLVTHRFNYLKFDDNILSLLAIWYSSGNEKCMVRLTVFGAPTPCLPDIHTIQLDNSSPEAYLSITSGTGDCGKFAIGAAIEGQFVARDKHFAEFSLGLLPVTIGGVAILNAVSPDDGYNQTPVYPGTKWTLSTTDMSPCGYNVHLISWDRTIINSQNTRRHSDAYVGFCLAKPSP